MQYLKRTREVFRQSLCAANDKRAAELRDTSKNHTAAVQAMRFLEREADDVARGAAARTPGVVIVIGQAPSSAPVTIDMPPLSTESVQPAGGDDDR
jgi:hypothetical protein